MVPGRFMIPLTLQLSLVSPEGVPRYYWEPLELILLVLGERGGGKIGHATQNSDPPPSSTIKGYLIGVKTTSTLYTVHWSYHDVTHAVQDHLLNWHSFWNIGKNAASPGLVHDWCVLYIKEVLTHLYSNLLYKNGSGILGHAVGLNAALQFIISTYWCMYIL